MQFILVIIVLFLGFDLKGQSNAIYPDNFSTYFNTLYLTDPSFVANSGNFTIGFSDKAKRISSDISTIGFHVEKIFRQKNNSAHLIRGIAWNEKEGPYIAYPRFYVNYARKISLGKYTALTAGVAFGFSGINFSTPSSSSSAKVPDGGIGLGFQFKKINMGVSSMQILNSTARALSLPVVLRRYYNLHLEANVNIKEKLEGRLYALYRHYTTMKEQYSLGLGLMYAKVAETGVMYQYNRGTTFFGGVQFFPELNPVYISFAYNTGLLSSLKSYNDYYEISIKYSITSKSNDAKSP